MPTTLQKSITAIHHYNSVVTGFSLGYLVEHSLQLDYGGVQLNNPALSFHLLHPHKANHCARNISSANYNTENGNSRPFFGAHSPGIRFACYSYLMHSISDCATSSRQERRYRAGVSSAPSTRSIWQTRCTKGPTWTRQ